MRKFVKTDDSHIVYLKDDEKEEIEKYENNDEYMEQFEF